ncbi:hypothetical protein J6590_097908 [Homalodisca vitripennis]|nr:hypothetical protein J6590_097908 [Homalodisca vitripennis]
MPRKRKCGLSKRSSRARAAKVAHNQESACGSRRAEKTTASTATKCFERRRFGCGSEGGYNYGYGTCTSYPVEFLN